MGERKKEESGVEDTKTELERGKAEKDHRE